MCDLLLSETGRILMIQFAASEQDLRYYPGVLGPYVREKKLVSFPEAIRRMTSLPAWNTPCAW